MNRLVVASVLSLGALAFTASSVKACMWDKEVVGHEKQFKSSYIDQPNASPVEAAPPLSQRLGSTVGVIGGVGVVMIVAAMVVGVVRHRESTTKTTNGNS